MRMSEDQGYVTAEYLRNAAKRAQQIKQKTYEKLRIEAGWKVLDVGCGLGIDVVAMAQQSPENCKFYGVDIDSDMLDEAESLAEENQVEDKVTFHLADVTELPFEDNFFDAVRAERLLQVLPKFLLPHETFKELLRVLKPGGRIVITDTDWASASIDIPNMELERRLVGFFAQYMRPNGIAGRQLYGMFKHHNLRETVAQAVTLIEYDFSKTPYGNWLKQEASKAGFASEEELNYWHNELSMLSKLGEFYSSVNIITVSGTK